MDRDALLTEITAFLSKTGMAGTTFGRLAVNDGKFVRRLRSGGRCWPETEEKARHFIRRQESGQQRTTTPAPEKVPA